MKVNDGTLLKYYYMTPGHVRMDMIKPFKDTTLVYDPTIHKVLVRPFNSLRGLVPEFYPDNPLVKSSKGHRVDESDILTLLRTLKELKDKGEIFVEDRGSSYYIDVRGKKGTTVRKVISRFVLILEKDTLFPKSAASYDQEGQLVEEVFFEDILINRGFSKDIFMLR